jgi:formate hydrogenlyase subunit 3/multisubunit Na+/H+ antiporter MnhD subunit
MVNPIYIIAILLGLGFLLPSIEKAGSKVTGTVFYAGLLSVFGISYQWFRHFMIDGSETVQILYGRYKPPLSINFQIGSLESVFLVSINFAALAGAIYMTKPIFETGVKAMVLFLLLIMGLNGLIMTRDLFNIFVFMEIVAISTYSLGAWTVLSDRFRQALNTCSPEGSHRFFFFSGSLSFIRLQAH